jgi:outer membrane protein
MRQFHWIPALLLCPLLAWGGETRTLNLDEAIQMALDHNRSLKAAATRLRSSEYGAREARSALLPHLAAKANYTRLDENPYIAPSNFNRLFQPIMAPFVDLATKGYLNPATLAGLQNIGANRIYMGLEDNYDFGFSLEQPIFSGGVLRNSCRIANLNMEMELWNYRTDEDQLRYDVIEAFLNLVKARELLKVTDESIERSQTHLTDLENMQAQGFAIQRDILRAQVGLSNARLQHVRAQNAVKLASSRLCNLLALDLDTELVPSEISQSEPDSLEPLSVSTARALDERPEMRAMKTTRAIAERQISICRGEFLPKVFLSGNYDWKRPNREIEPDFYATWNVTLAAQFDLFHGGARLYRLEQANLAVREISENSATLSDAIRLEVQQARLGVEEAQDALKIAEETVVQAQESYRVTGNNFKVGMATSADVLDAQTDLTQAQMQQVAAHAELLVARAKLARATGV